MRPYLGLVVAIELILVLLEAKLLCNLGNLPWKVSGVSADKRQMMIDCADVFSLTGRGSTDWEMSISSGSGFFTARSGV